MSLTADILTELKRERDVLTQAITALESLNGNTPKTEKASKSRQWTPERRRKFMATLAKRKTRTVAKSA